VVAVMKILGIDPGICGGLSVIAIDDGAAPQLIDAIDIPTVGLAAKERVDVAAVCAFINKHAPQHAYIERAQAMPKQGASSGFKYGRAVGALEAAVAFCIVPLTIVEPSVWKNILGLRGGEKESSRQLALQLFPAAHTVLARKKDHGRAEAALIALAGLKVSAAYAAGSTSEASPTPHAQRTRSVPYERSNEPSSAT
jgi:Holliday junction resolvasome RuvABC endonuclease subunit